jgi:phage protein U
MSDVLLAMGPYLFYATAPSFEKLKFQAAFRLAEQPRLARDVAHQFLGPGARQVNLNGIMYPEAFGGAELLSAIHAGARAGIVFPLIAMSDASLTGDVMGMWQIHHIANTRTYFGVNGARKIEFELSLLAYGEDNGFIGGLF